MSLIDTDTLFKELNEEKIPWNRRINDIIMNQQTAYEVDKVVEQLERASTEETLVYNGVKVGTVKVLTLKNAVEIVKKGGKMVERE